MSEQAKHVLLIEDNPGDADLIRLRLVEGKSPVDVNCVERLSDGLAYLDGTSPSVVLLDLNLPDSQGAETFRRVLAKAPDVPVVILSGQDDEALAIRALHQGVQDYLVKGDISRGELDRAMRHAIERQALLHSLDISRKQQLEFKNQFLSHVSHELRTPLTCIHQFVTILLDGLAGEMSVEQREHLRTILRSVNQLGAMVRDLLEASRAESRKIRLEPRCVSIADLIHSAASMMRATAHEKRIGLEVGVEDSIPYVHGDPDRILEVLINLIENAIKFTPADGSVTVQASRLPTDLGQVCISVVRYRMRHRARGAGADLRTPLSGPECNRQQPQRAGSRLVHCQRTGRTAWWTDVGSERARQWEHLLVHAAALFARQVIVPGDYA